MPGEHDEQGDPRYLGLRSGVVVANNDPKKLGRVKLRIPGLIDDESAWAFPLGTFGGTAQRGAYAPPPKDSEVGVFFLEGDVDKPFYIGGHWGEPGGAIETPGPVGGYQGANDPADLPTADDAPLVPAWEGKRYMIVVDEREGKERLYLRDKLLDDEVEMDGAKGGITVRASSGIALITDGAVVIDAVSCTIMGRSVLPSDNPIK